MNGNLGLGEVLVDSLISSCSHSCPDIARLEA